MAEGKKGLSLKIKSVIFVLVMSVILCGVAVTVSAYTFSDTNENSYKDHARDIAYTAAANANGDEVRALADLVLGQFHAIPEKDIVTSDDLDSPEFDAFTARFAWIMDTSEYATVRDYLYNVVNKADIDTLSAIYISVYDTTRSEPYSLYLAVAAE